MFYQPSVKCCTMLTHSVTLRRWWWMKTRAGLVNQNIEVTRRGLQDRCRFGETASDTTRVLQPVSLPNTRSHVRLKSCDKPSASARVPWFVFALFPVHFKLCYCVADGTPYIRNDKLRCSYPTRYGGYCQTVVNLSKEQLLMEQCETAHFEYGAFIRKNFITNHSWRHYKI